MPRISAEDKLKWGLPWRFEGDPNIIQNVFLLSTDNPLEKSVIKLFPFVPQVGSTEED